MSEGRERAVLIKATHGECSFCREMNGVPEESRFYRLLGADLPRRFLWETENFVVVPGIGHLTQGYVLIRSRRHFLSISLMPLDPVLELEELRASVTRELRRIFLSDVICFEHGSVSETRKGAGCTDHLHLHVLPTPRLLKDRLNASVALMPITSFAQLSNYAVMLTPYILYGQNDELFAFEAKLLPKQFMRRLVATALDHPEHWDWRQGVDAEGYAVEPSILGTIARLEQRPGPLERSAREASTQTYDGGEQQLRLEE